MTFNTFSIEPRISSTGINDNSWTFDAPAHWNRRRLRFLCEINPSRSSLGVFASSLPVSFLPMELSREKDPDFEPATMPYGEISNGYTAFRDGDLLIAKITPCFENGKGGICRNLTNGIGFGSTEFHVLRPTEELNQYFLYYATICQPFRDIGAKQMRGAAGQQRVPVEFLLDFVLPYPPRAEQDAIVAFLDEKLADIDRYIAAKQRLIGLLDEQKAAIINQAVTQGLNPAVEMKESGVEWLGEIPVHWKMIKLSRVANVLNGTTPSRNQPDYWQQGTIPWLSSGKVNDYFVETPAEYITDKALRECSLSIIPTGSIIMGMIGQGKTRGMTAYLGIDTCINQNLAAIVPKGELNGRFLHHFLTFAYKPLRDYGRGGNQEALNCEIISSFRVPLPPSDEQNSIAVYLDSTTKELSDAKRYIEREIELMQELRTALIAEAVTGKIDVRKQG